MKITRRRLQKLIKNLILESAMPREHGDIVEVKDVAEAIAAIKAGKGIRMSIPLSVVKYLSKYTNKEGVISPSTDIGDMIVAATLNEGKEGYVLAGMLIAAITGLIAYCIHVGRSVRVRFKPGVVLPGSEGEIVVLGGDEGELPENIDDFGGSEGYTSEEMKQIPTDPLEGIEGVEVEGDLEKVEVDW